MICSGENDTGACRGVLGLLLCGLNLVLGECGGALVVQGSLDRG